MAELCREPGTEPEFSAHTKCRGRNGRGNGAESCKKEGFGLEFKGDGD